MNLGELLVQRNEKDQYIKSEHSPFPPAMREKFDGLSYYPPSEDFFFEIEIEVYKKKEKIVIEQTDGQTLKAKRFGKATFMIEEQTVSVVILDHQGSLAIIFKDATNGTETYEGGRSFPVTATKDGKYIIDFNVATNPMCAYMNGYACPIPIPENHLDIAITAGEKMPVGAWVLLA